MCLCAGFSGSTVQNWCISLGMRSSIKYVIRMLLHAVYTKSRIIIVFVRLYPYCSLFPSLFLSLLLSLYPQLPA